MKTIKPVFNVSPRDEAFKKPDYESQEALRHGFYEALKTAMDPRYYGWRKDLKQDFENSVRSQLDPRLARYEKKNIAKEGL